MGRRDHAHRLARIGLRSDIEGAAIIRRGEKYKAQRSGAWRFSSDDFAAMMNASTARIPCRRSMLRVSNSVRVTARARPDPQYAPSYVPKIGDRLLDLPARS